MREAGGDEPPFPAAIAEEKRRTVRATLADGLMLVQEPRVTCDTLQGWRHEGSDTPPVRIPLSAIERLEARRVDALGTVGLVAGVGAGLALTLWIAVLDDFSDPDFWPRGARKVGELVPPELLGKSMQRTKQPVPHVQADG